jgi:hypothetical protein
MIENLKLKTAALILLAWLLRPTLKIAINAP